MSANGDGDDEIPGRELAYRLFAAEYDDASFSYAESDEERAPNYVITPTGARLNRVFAVGTLTEVTSVNDEMVRARVVDPTGAFVVYAGQYQPDELAFLEQAEPPAFVAVTGKARTFQPDDSDQVYTSIRPESIATVDADTRDRWVVSAAEQTLDRIGTYAGAAELDLSSEKLTDALLEADVESGLAAGIPLAREHYGTTPSYLAALRACAL
ncbi:RPA family protein, partial [Natrinema soli]